MCLCVCVCVCVCVGGASAQMPPPPPNADATQISDYSVRYISQRLTENRSTMCTIMLHDKGKAEVLLVPMQHQYTIFM